MLGHVNKSSVSCEIALSEGLFMWFSNKSRGISTSNQETAV